MTDVVIYVILGHYHHYLLLLFETKLLAFAATLPFTPIFYRALVKSENDAKKNYAQTHESNCIML